MRSVVGVSILFALLLTSCNKSKPSPVAAGKNEQSQASSDAGSEDHAHGHKAMHEGEAAEHSGGVHGHHSHAPQGIAIGDHVPDFEVSWAGKRWKLSELQQNRELTEDGTLVLTFWCSFCHSCRDIEHELDALATKYQGKVGVIALDASAGETTEGVSAFAAKRKLSLPIALDESGTTAEIIGTRVTTTTVVIDKDGKLRYRGQFGDRQHAYAHDALQAVLAQEEVSVKETRHRG